jgi:teichuronic acid biosynthesis glycosyltransferase TuaC
MVQGMRIVLVTNLFPNPLEPNRGIFVANMVRHLRTKCKLTVISPLPWFPRSGFLQRFKKWYKFSLVPGEYMFEGLKVLCPKYIAIPKCGFLHSISLYWCLLPVLRKMKNGAGVDVINVQWIFPDGVAVSWIAGQLNIPFVITAHGSDINIYLKYRLRAKQILGALRKSDRITVVSKALKESLSGLDIDSDKITVIYNGVDFSIFNHQDQSQGRSTLKISYTGKIILFVGRLVQVKGLVYLIEAVARLKKKYAADFRVYLVGDGPLKSTLQKMACDFGAVDRIEFAGERGHSEIPFWYAASDVFCLPSKNEGCPSVILESLASARPVVASRVGGIPELINSDNGILFESGDVNGLMDALKRALENRWDRQKIVDTIKGYSWENTADNYLSVFQQAIS